MNDLCKLCNGRSSMNTILIKTLLCAPTHTLGHGLVLNIVIICTYGYVLFFSDGLLCCWVTHIDRDSATGLLSSM